MIKEQKIHFFAKAEFLLDDKGFIMLSILGQVMFYNACSISGYCIMRLVSVDIV